MARMDSSNKPTNLPYHHTTAQFSPAFHDFIRLCLAKSPAERPPARRLLTHPFVRPAAAAAPLIRQLRRGPQPPPLSQVDAAGQGGGSESACGELVDIVRAVQAHYRRRWARSAAAAAAAEGGLGAEAGGGTSLLLLEEMEEQEGLAAVPNTSAKALGGLARQLGLPLGNVRRAFQGMVKELVRELEAGADAGGGGGGGGDGGIG